MGVNESKLKSPSVVSTSRYSEVNKILKNIPPELIDDDVIRRLEAAYERVNRFNIPHSDIPMESPLENIHE
ncbi:hypothetical protein HNY73_011720 [Argiope bruennichi]|uniref:Uncharacterized protein n=1 Tax=Argiope bruennichi TaxID=94029 RepID=A0A8T0F4X8_ARGBR|nr:hypothetical protein HNY73_011720 [Argiope bruennichi]